MRIRGEQMYLFSGELGAELRPIALSTDCALTLESEAVEVARTSPSVRKFRKGLLSWSIDCANLASLAGFDGLAVAVGQPITVAITILQKEAVAAGVNLAGIKPDKTVTLVGQSIITSASITGAKAQISAYRISFVGNGQIGALVEQNGFPYVLPIIF